MNRYRSLGIALLGGALLLAGTAGNALAWSAAACTDIANRASLTFKVGNVDQGILESSDAGNSTLGAGNGGDTTFTVDSRVSLAVDTIATPVGATGTDQVLRFRVTNLGNDVQRYRLQLYPGTDGGDDVFDMDNVRVYRDANDDELWDGGDALLATDPAPGAWLGYTLDVDGDGVDMLPGVDNTIVIFVVADVKPGRVTNDTAAYALKATSYQRTSVVDGGGNPVISITDSVANGGTEADNSCGNPVVIGDGDSSATKTAVGGVTDEARNGAAYDSGVYQVVAAGISVQKTQRIVYDEFNGGFPNAQAIPGAYVQYQIIIRNAPGAAAATLTQITDDLDARLAFDPDLIDTTGAEEDAAGNGFKVEHSSGRSLIALPSPSYYTTSDADAGVGHDGSATGGTITAIFAELLPAEGVAYAAGELKGGESVTLTFNAIIQ